MSVKSLVLKMKIRTYLEMKLIIQVGINENS